MTAGRISKGAVALSVAGLAVLGFQAPVVAQEGDRPGRGPGCPNPGGNYPSGRCDRGVSDSTVERGQTVVFSSGSDFCPEGSSVTFEAPGNRQTLVSGPTGNTNASYTAPSDARPGRYEGVFTCVNGNVARIPFTIVGSQQAFASALPRTGADHVAELTAAGIGLVAVGGLTVAAARRRRDDVMPV